MSQRIWVVEFREDILGSMRTLVWALATSEKKAIDIAREEAQHLHSQAWFTIYSQMTDTADSTSSRPLISVDRLGRVSITNQPSANNAFLFAESEISHEH